MKKLSVLFIIFLVLISSSYANVGQEAIKNYDVLIGYAWSTESTAQGANGPGKYIPYVETDGSDVDIGKFSGGPLHGQQFYDYNSQGYLNSQEVSQYAEAIVLHESKSNDKIGLRNLNGVIFDSEGIRGTGFQVTVPTYNSLDVGNGQSIDISSDGYTAQNGETYYVDSDGNLRRSDSFLGLDFLNPDNVVDLNSPEGQAVIGELSTQTNPEIQDILNSVSGQGSNVNSVATVSGNLVESGTPTVGTSFEFGGETVTYVVDEEDPSGYSWVGADGRAFANTEGVTGEWQESIGYTPGVAIGSPGLQSTLGYYRLSDGDIVGGSAISSSQVTIVNDEAVTTYYDDNGDVLARYSYSQGIYDEVGGITYVSGMDEIPGTIIRTDNPWNPLEERTEFVATDQRDANGHQIFERDGNYYARTGEESFELYDSSSINSLANTGVTSTETNILFMLGEQVFEYQGEEYAYTSDGEVRRVNTIGTSEVTDEDIVQAVTFYAEHQAERQIVNGKEVWVTPEGTIMEVVNGNLVATGVMTDMAQDMTPQQGVDYTTQQWEDAQAEYDRVFAETMEMANSIWTSEEEFEEQLARLEEASDALLEARRNYNQAQQDLRDSETPIQGYIGDAILTVLDLRSATAAGKTYNTLFADDEEYYQRLGEFDEKYRKYFPQDFLARYSYGLMFESCRDTENVPLVSDGVALVNTPDGTLSYAASVQGLISHVYVDNETTEYLYKVTYHIRNPSRDDWSYSVIVDTSIPDSASDGMQVDSGTVSAYASAGRTTADMITRYSGTKYSHICIFVNNAQFSRVCNTIEQEDMTISSYSDNTISSGDNGTTGRQDDTEW